MPTFPRLRRSAVRGAALAVVPLVVAATLGACGDDSSPESGGSGGPGDLEGTSWVLTGWTLNAGEDVREPVAETVLELAAVGRASGSGGCNRFFGSWEQAGRDLSIRVGGTTEMACAPPVAEQEMAVFAALDRTTSFSLDDGTLRLLDGDGAVLLEYSTGVEELAGTSWTATGINNGRGALESTATTEQASVTFGTDGTISGTGGCNTFSGPVTVTPPDGIEVAGELRTTLMACADPAVDLQEQQFLAALQRATTYELSGSTLTLRDDDGAMQATFRLDPDGGTGDGTGDGSGGTTTGDPDTPVSSPGG